mmetsp:Transcript_22892/g.56527  ORF Transcript_22892/g.56527 Transcript_22892/m.56527 type:complete len:330 (-) Transcript_22892:2091-3080(-)
MALFVTVMSELKVETAETVSSSWSLSASSAASSVVDSVTADKSASEGLFDTPAKLVSRSVATVLRSFNSALIMTLFCAFRSPSVTFGSFPSICLLLSALATLMARTSRSPNASTESIGGRTGPPGWSPFSSSSMALHTSVSFRASRSLSLSRSSVMSSMKKGGAPVGSSGDTVGAPVVATQGEPGMGQVQPVSVWQASLHPSPLMRLPSSHCSEPFRRPSAHTGSQSNPGVGQDQPDSIIQPSVQPSPVFRLPSSHCSLPFQRPSPHTDAQGDPCVEHVHPVSMLQESLHPSPLKRLPSSHCSLPFTRPSPQIGVHGDPGVMHCHPVSS